MINLSVWFYLWYFVIVFDQNLKKKTQKTLDVETGVLERYI